MCLVGVFPHAFGTRRDPCVRVYTPLTLPPYPSPAGKQIRNHEGVTRLSTKRGGIWTDALVCLLGDSLGCWVVQFPHTLQFMGCVIGRIHYGLKVVFCVRHFTAFHYHHYARLLTGTEHINVCRLSCLGVSSMLLFLSITFYFHCNKWGCVC